MRNFSLSIFCLIVFAAITTESFASDQDDMLELPALSFTSLTLSGASQRKADMDTGGQFGITRISLSANHTVLQDRNEMHGFGISYRLDSYEFSGQAGSAFERPWGKINQVMATASFMRSLAEDWHIFTAPLVGLAGEQGADVGKTVVYGGIVSVSHRFSPDLVMGFGGGIFQRAEETIYFPSLAVRWQITSRLRLANSFRTGPAGPAGLELAYAFDDNWELAIGGARRSNRFRLGKTGSEPDGIGETKFSIGNLRLSRRLGRGIKADLYAGTVRNGSLSLKDKDGNTLASTKYDKTRILCLTVSSAF